MGKSLCAGAKEAHRRWGTGWCRWGVEVLRCGIRRFWPFGFQFSMQDLGKICHYRRNLHFELKDFGNFVAGQRTDLSDIHGNVFLQTFFDRKKVQRKEWEEWLACSDCCENFIQHSNVDVQWRKLFSVFSMRSTSTSIYGPANEWNWNNFEPGKRRIIQKSREISESMNIVWNLSFLW